MGYHEWRGKTEKYFKEMNLSADKIEVSICLLLQVRE